jgi:hypothetical protein
MNGIPGFAEGFSGGLNQGLGIMRNFRDEKRQVEAFELQRQQTAQNMEIQRAGEPIARRRVRTVRRRSASSWAGPTSSSPSASRGAWKRRRTSSRQRSCFPFTRH